MRPPRTAPAALLALCGASLLAGCGGISSAGPQRTANANHPGPLAESAIRRDERELRRRSYTPDRQVVSSIGTQPLYVFHSVCTGSLDGHCQAVDAFRGSDSRPLWHGDFLGVLSLRPSPQGFTVVAVSYGPNDSLAEPTRPPVVDTYTWTGSRFAEHGALPGSPRS